MAHWSIRVQVALPAPLTDEQADTLVTALIDHQPALTAEPESLSVRFDVEAADLLAAINFGARLVTDTLRDQLHVDTAHSAVEGCTYEELERQLAQPQVPPLAGMKEVGDILGVSRQRIHELSERPDFPTPVQKLAAGNIYVESAVRAFSDRWDRRRSGRPRVDDEAMLCAAIGTVLAVASLDPARRYQFQQALSASGGRYVMGKALLLTRLPAELRQETVERLRAGSEVSKFLSEMSRAAELTNEGPEFTAWLDSVPANARGGARKL